jgi:hypothetical protein
MFVYAEKCSINPIWSSVLVNMSFPVSKRIVSAGCGVRGAKKASVTIPSDGCLEIVEDSIVLNSGSSVTIAGNAAAAVASSIASVDDFVSQDGPKSAVSFEPASPGSNRSKFMANASVDDSVGHESPNASASLVPASPGSNRSRFMANCQPLQVCCDLATVGMHNASVRFSFTAVVLIVYPETKGPDRRHVQLIDSRGSTGITVWNENVRLFSASSVGQVVRFTKLAMTISNGKKGLSMGRDSSVVFLHPLSVPTEEAKWWASKLLEQPLRIIDVHDCDDDVVITTAGIVGMMSTERKRVRDQDKDLLCIRLTDRTGFIDIRSWTHSEHEFLVFLEKPLLLQRVRVTAFAGIKTLELLAGSGTVLKDDFNGKNDLQQYWAE